MVESSKTRPRWLRYGLRSLLVVSILSAALMAWVSNHHHQYRMEQALIQSLSDDLQGTLMAVSTNGRTSYPKINFM